MPAVTYKNMYISTAVHRDRRADLKLIAIAEVRREETGEPIRLFAWADAEFKNEQIAHAAALDQAKAWIDQQLAAEY